MNKTILTIMALVLPAWVAADVELTMVDMDGRNSVVSSNGSLVRIDGDDIPGYVILDPARGQFHMVDVSRNQIMRASVDSGAAGGASVNVDLRDKGGGRVVAGYQTRKFEFSADGQSCGVIYASKKLLQHSGVQAMFEAMRELQQQSRRYANALGGMIGPCERANLELADAMRSTGVPMRVQGSDGRLVSEITRVDTDKSYPSDHYSLPSGMAQVDMSEQMNQAAQQAGEMMQNMPEMNELMEQMQGAGGQMSDEMQQQLQQMQEMLQQLQQQQQ